MVSESVATKKSNIPIQSSKKKKKKMHHIKTNTYTFLFRDLCSSLHLVMKDSVKGLPTKA